MSGFFGADLEVINVGIPAFADNIRASGAPAVNLEWRPPGDGDPDVARALATLINRESVEAGNQTAFARYRGAQPVLEGVAAAGETVPGMGERTILHSGPPIDWTRMCGPVRGAIVGAVLYESWAADAARADALIESGEVVLEPCHQHGAVGPMAGIISPSMPVWIVTNTAHGNKAYSNLNEGLGKVLRFGANSPEVLDRLRWMGTVLGPALARMLEQMGGLELKPLMAQALHMGDEIHNRNAAASSLLFRRLMPAALKSGIAHEELEAVTDFITGNDHFFLNISMAACKSMLDAASGVAGSSLVTAMARNGVEFGIRLSGCGDRWFTTAAPVVDGLYFAGYSTADAAPDLGDSSITETAGVGGFAMAAAPAIVQFVGGSPDDAISSTNEMTHITLGRNEAFTLPPLDFVGTPAGIDARKVVDTGITPVINTGIAHREPGVGQIGAGITRAPLACFTQAVVSLAESLEADSSPGGD
ncbi:MAG: DUF1116 domain-containing protein [Gammaproteobacteria bacterium]|nr:DUF1116 domain-containing protein [Gammaproteobacteria bacterium]